MDPKMYVFFTLLSSSSKTGAAQQFLSMTERGKSWRAAVVSILGGPK